MEVRTRKKGWGQRRKKDLIFVACLVALPLLHFFIFWICVNFNSILLAFKKYDVKGNYDWVFFKNFASLFEDFKHFTLFEKALKNSIAFFVIGTAASAGLSLMFSYYIYKQAPMKNLFKILLFMPSIIPGIAMSTIFKQFVENAVPSLMKLLFGIQMKGLLQNPETTMGTILFFNIWVGFGTNILLYLGAMCSISDSVVEAAKLDGVTFFQEFIYITFPSVFSTFRTLLIVALGGVFTNGGGILNFFGTTAEEAHYTIGYYLYIQTVGSTLNNSYVALPKVASFGLLLTAITLPMVFTTNWALRRYGPRTED